MQQINPLLLASIILAVSFVLDSNLNTAKAVPGDLDSSFGNDGRVTTPIGSSITGYRDVANAVALQADGKILLGGYSYNHSTSITVFALTRYNSNGSLDTTFSDDGKLATSINNNADIATSLAVQPDGKILLGGISRINSTDNFALVRYTNNGLLDTTFGNNGVVITPIGSEDSVAKAMAIQRDGKILLAGFCNNMNYDFAVVRYNSNGSLDTTFDADGIVTTSIMGEDIAYTMALQPDGKILVGGYSLNYDFALIRYNSNGTLDTSFDEDGILTLNINNEDIAQALAVQPDGKILLGGISTSYSSFGTDHDFTLVRFHSDGSLDTSFDTDGIVTTTGNDDLASSIGIQPDGKILLGGSSDGNFSLMRYNSNGALDTSFDLDGILTTTIGILGSGAKTLAIQADGKILLGGTSTDDLNQNDFTLVRYLANDANDDGTAESWDLTPNAFSFTGITNVIAASTQTTENITITGLDSGITVPVTVNGGEYAINEGSYTSNMGYVQNTDIIFVRHTASATASTLTSTTLTVGGLNTANNMAVILATTASDTFTSTTEPGPNAFSFTDVTGVALASTSISNSITISGMTHAMAISVIDGEYSVNSGSFTNANGSIVNGDNVRVRHTSANTTSTSVSTTLTVGGVSDTFTSTTTATSTGGGGGGSLNWPLIWMLGASLLWCRRIQH